LVSKVLHWLALYLHEDIDHEFKLSEWRMRTDALEIQDKDREDCAQYVITHAMYLAFGYGIKYHGTTFVWNHRSRMEARRRRIAQDLLSRGFTHYDSRGSSADNEQYYPVLDTPPTAWAEDGWRPLDTAVIQALEA
jgi:hypothetical protein